MWARPLSSHTPYNHFDQGPNDGVENEGVVVSEEVNFMRTLGAEHSVGQFSDLHTPMCDSASRIDIFPHSLFTNILLMHVYSKMESWRPKPSRESHCAQTKALQQTVPEELEHLNFRWLEMCHMSHGLRRSVLGLRTKCNTVYMPCKKVSFRTAFGEHKTKDTGSDKPDRYPIS